MSFFDDFLRYRQEHHVEQRSEAFIGNCLLKNYYQKKAY